MRKINFSVFILLLLITGCGKSETGGQQNNARPAGGWASGGFGGARTTSVETSVVTLNPIAEQVKSYGSVKSQNVVEILPQVSNRITKIYVDLGDSVRQGQLLAKIFDATIRDQLNQAISQVGQSKIAVSRDSSQFERQKLLAERELISESEYEIALATYQNSIAQYETANASLTQAQENFNNTEVRSPVPGVVTARNLEEGDLATTGQSLFEIAGTTGYESRIYLPVQDWRAVKIGQQVNLRATNDKESSAQGIVSRKSPQLDPTTGLGEVVITLTSIGNSIYPGVLTESVIDIVNKPRAVVVSRSALVEKVETVIEPESNTIQLERTFSVFVSKGDSVAELRTLTLGIEQGDRIEVLAGLRIGESIIVTGQQSLEDGGTIRVASGANFQSPQDQPVQTNEANQGQQQGRPGVALFTQMSEEERAKIRERMQSMSREERRAYMDSLRTANNPGN